MLVMAYLLYQKSQIEKPANMIEEPLALANSVRDRLWKKLKAEEEEEKRKREQKLAENKDKKPKKLKNYYLEEPVYSEGKWCTYSPSRRADWHYRRGCIGPLKSWLNSSSDILFVIGFCVIGFLKFVFLSILHYEIREMIQKIHMLENETNQMNGGLAAVLGLGPEIRSISSSPDQDDSRSRTPSCHSSQKSLHPPQTANTILSYPLAEKSPQYTFHEHTKNTLTFSNSVGPVAKNSANELIDKNPTGEITNTNLKPMDAVTTQQLINTDTYGCPTLPPPPTKTIKSTGNEPFHGASNISTHPNRNLNLDTEIFSGSSLPQSHDIITSSTPTTAQSSSESTINKQGELVNRSSEASILSPQSEGWPLRQQNYFQNNGPELGILGFEGSNSREKHQSECHELSNKQFSTDDPSMKIQYRGSMDEDKSMNRSNQPRINDRNVILNSNRGYGGKQNMSICANPSSSFMKTQCIAEVGLKSGNGNTSKQTAI